jgi:hypothetical protein
MIPDEPIPRVPALDRTRVFEEYIRPGVPVILTGGSSNWGPMAGWTPEYLERKLNGKLVKAAISPRGVFRYGLGETGDYATVTFREAAAAIRSGGPHGSVYLMQQPIAASFPELADDVRAPRLPGAITAPAHLWFGSPNNVTPLHYDPLCNLFRQVYGRKRFLLYSPRFFEEMYPLPIDAPFCHVSPVDAEQPDADRHPRFLQAQTREVVLNAGDTLFLPPFWWHCVRSLEVSISVNFWWAPELRHCLVPAGLRLLAGAYESDRLATAGAPFRRADGFLGAAREILALRLRWPAILLAGAEIEQALRTIAVNRGIACSNDGLLQPLATLNRELSSAGAYAPELANTIARLDAWLELARRNDDERIGEQQAVDVIDEVERLVYPSTGKP